MPDLQNVGLRWNVEHHTTSLQSKVCTVDCSLNLNCIGEPQKGQRGHGASMSMRLVVKSKVLIDGKDEPYPRRDDRAGGEGRPEAPRNVLGEVLEICSITPMTGFYRDGCCNTGREDMGSHTVCAVMTAAFLEFSKSRGNDLSTPLPEFGFPGLKPGDRWCLCAPRWQEAFEANQAPRVVLRATHEGALAHCSLGDLKRFAVDLA